MKSHTFIVNVEARCGPVRGIKPRNEDEVSLTGPQVHVQLQALVFEPLESRHTDYDDLVRAELTLHNARSESLQSDCSERVDGTELALKGFNMFSWLHVSPHRYAQKLLSVPFSLDACTRNMRSPHL